MALILPEHYPRFTLIRQALGSLRLGWEALSQLVPEVGAAVSVLGGEGVGGWRLEGEGGGATSQAQLA